MSLAFTELLDNSEFFKGSEVDISKIQHASIIDILEFCSQSVELSSADDISTGHSLLSHTASLSLSGSIYPCAALECRLKRVKELSQFSAFYSDRIYINNFLSEHLTHLDEDTPPDEDTLKHRFAEDLIVLSYLKPFISAERIVPITPPSYCKHCLAKVSFGNKDDRRIDKAYRDLVRDYRNEAHLFVKKVGEVYLVHAEAPERLLEHGFHVTVANKLPAEITQMPRIMSAIESGEEVELSRTLKNRTKYNEYLAGNMFSGIVYELAMTNSLQTSYLSDSALEINFIKNLTNDADVEIRNHILEKYLTCFVPFVGDIEPSVVLKIREEEGESFLLFRQRLNEAVSEVQSQKRNIRAKDAKQIFHDVLEPQLAKLDVDIKSAKRLLVKDARRTTLGWTAAITFGLYTGLLPQGVAAAAAALGLTNVIADFLGDTMKKSDTEEVVRSSDMYFLWKVRKESEKIK